MRLALAQASAPTALQVESLALISPVIPPNCAAPLQKLQLVSAGLASEAPLACVPVQARPGASARPFSSTLMAAARLPSTRSLQLAATRVPLASAQPEALA